MVVENIAIDAAYLQDIKDKNDSTYLLIPLAEFELGVQRLETFIANRSSLAYTEWWGMLVCSRKRG